MACFRLKVVNLLGTVLSKHESAAFHHKQCQKIPKAFQMLLQTTLIGTWLGLACR